MLMMGRAKGREMGRRSCDGNGMWDCQNKG